MCVVSNIGDAMGRDWGKRYPWIDPAPKPTIIRLPPEVSKAEVDALRREVENLKKLLKLAKAVDVATGQADCEMEEKVALFKRIAELVGIDLDEVLAERAS